MHQTDISQLVDEGAACRILGGEESPIHRSTLWRGINAGRYPAPLKIGPATNRWRVDDLRAALDRMAGDRDQEIARLRSKADAMAAHADALEADGGAA